MTTLTLMTRIYNSHQLRQMDAILADLVEGLDVQATIIGTLANRWVQVDVSGEDESVLTKLLERDMSFCPVTLANVKKFASLKGYITGLEKSGEELTLDIGVVQPAAVHAVVPLKHLQANLAGGKKLSLKQLGELWGFCDNLPLQIKVLNVNTDANQVEAQLQDSQIHRFELWRDSLLDRLLVIGASQAEVDDAITHAGLARDVIDVETLGIFEHALVCKLGTDAAGLIGAIGRMLRKAKFTVFNPKKIQIA
jgi:hypothetical protein